MRWAVAAVVAIGAVAAAMSATAPTGHAQIDAIERAAVTALVALAATRAQRWTLVTASVMVTVATSDGWAVLGVGALAGAAWLVLPNRRHRVAASAVGAAIAVTAMHLDVDRFHGASTLVGLAACAVVLGSGYARLDHGVRRRWNVAAAATAVVVVTVVGIAALFVAVSRDDLRQAQELTRAGVADLRDGRTGTASSAFATAADHFGSARRLIGSVALAPARLVPVVSQNISTLETVVEVGEDLAGAASEAAAGVDYERVRRPDGGIDLAAIRSFERPVLRTERLLRSARATVDAVPRGWLLPPLASPFRQFAREVRVLAADAELARLSVEQAPPLLGRDGPRRYLVMLGNPAEARDLGGHIGNWVELTVDEGRFDLVEVGGPLDIADHTASSLTDPDRIPPRLSGMRPARFPQNWSAYPDMPTVTDVAANIFERVTGRPIDGVAYADPAAFAAFVALAGPVPVPELEGEAIDASNAARFVIVDQFERFPNDAAADAAMSTVIATVFDRLTTAELPGPRALADRFSPLTREGRFRFWSLRDDAGALLRRVGLAGELRVPDGGDVIAVLSRNANPSKIDRFLHRDVEVAIDWDPSTGAVSSSVAVTVRNEAPSTGASHTVLGNALGLPVGTNVSDLAIVTPLETERVTVDGRDAPSRSQWNDGAWYHEVRLVIPPGGSSEVDVDLRGFVASGPTYRLRVHGQPLVNGDRTTVRVTPAAPAGSATVERRFRGPRTREVVVSAGGNWG